jgi:hypothetical protein
MKLIFKILIAGFLICSFYIEVNAQEDKGLSGGLLQEIDAIDRADFLERELGGSTVRQMQASEIREIQNNMSQLKDAEKRTGEMFGHFGKIISAVSSASALYKAMNALDNNECVPDFTTDASDMMPSGCDEEDACSACYEKAISRMNNVRKNLARMSCLRINTKKYVESAIAFGDNVSGLHGAFGLAWQNEKIGIKASYEKFKKTYDTKYIEMMESLETALKEINQCEAEFGMKDWYQKAGFIYFEMMKERYKRTD